MVQAQDLTKPYGELVDTFIFTPTKIIQEDTVAASRDELVEGKKITGVEGIFAEADRPTANGRVYSTSLWQRVLSPESPATANLRSMGMVGELNHPPDGRGNLKEGAILIINLTLKEDGKLYGKAEIIDDLPCAEMVRAYLKKGVRLGISSRGRGSVSSNGTVQDDYMLETFDVVQNPAVQIAILSPISEDNQKITNKGGNDMDYQSILERTQLRAKTVSSLVGEKPELTEAMKDLLTTQTKTLIEQLDPLIKQDESPSVQTEAKTLQEELIVTKKIIVDAPAPKPPVSEDSTGDDSVADDTTVDVVDLMTKPKTEDDDDDKAKAEADAKAKAEADAKVKADANAKAKAEADAAKDDTDYSTVEDVEKLRARIKELDEKNKKLEDDAKLNEEALKALEVNAAEVESLYLKSLKVIEEMKANVEKTKVDVAVKEEIERNPKLVPFKLLFEDAKTVDDVKERAKVLIDATLGVSTKTNKKHTASDSLPNKGSDTLVEDRTVKPDADASVKPVTGISDTAKACARMQGNR